MKLHLCKWDYLPYPVKRTLQIGRLFIGRHFPGCSCWSVDVSTRRASTCLSLKHGPYAIASPGWDYVPYLRSLFSPWKMITLHLGPMLIVLAIARTSAIRYEDALTRAHITPA